MWAVGGKYVFVFRDVIWSNTYYSYKVNKYLFYNIDARYLSPYLQTYSQRYKRNAQTPILFAYTCIYNF